MEEKEMKRKRYKGHEQQAGKNSPSSSISLQLPLSLHDHSSTTILLQYLCHIYLVTMRFSTITMSALLSLAAASPNALARRENQATTQAIQFAALQADCDIFKCASVVASAACIAASIALGPAGVASALGCTAGGAASV